MQQILEAVNRRILEKWIIHQESTNPAMEVFLDSLVTEISDNKVIISIYLFSSHGASSSIELQEAGSCNVQ